MGIQLDEKKYPHPFIYLAIIYLIVLVWALSLSWPAYTFAEAQLFLVIMILPLILTGIYARINSHQRLFRYVISLLAIVAMFVSALMGYVFL